VAFAVRLVEAPDLNVRVSYVEKEEVTESKYAGEVPCLWLAGERIGVG
jgi:hypothetical protein